MPDNHVAEQKEKHQKRPDSYNMSMISIYGNCCLDNKKDRPDRRFEGLKKIYAPLKKRFWHDYRT
jgi:hypothetical protein